MLGFLRKHQKYFYIIITIVIVISFSFFGTYNTLAGNAVHEQVAFVAVDGSPITRYELEEFSSFLGSDGDDARLAGGAQGPNFLNDGVIKKDFLETGLAEILIRAYEPDLKNDLISKRTKELYFKPYSHPDAKFIGSVTAWTYFAPDILSNLQRFQQLKDPMDPAAINSKIALYLAEKKFPAPYLRQILLHQEKQYPWISPDDSLQYQDLALFGYRNLDDWFGPKFTRLIAQFIINASKIAEQKGYAVSKEEALSDLLRNATLSFKENQSNPHFSVSNPGDYFEQALVRMHLDRAKAVKIWRQVLLFRRLFHDVGNAVFVDRANYDAFNKFASEAAVGDLYRLPEAVRLSDFHALERFETYLDAISKRTKEGKLSFALPDQFLSPEEVAKRAPELVQKVYLVELSQISKKNLKSRVSVKDTLSWEIESDNWKTLKNEFPDLGMKKAASDEEKLDALDSLDTVTRNRVDNFARTAIVNAHPEWIDQALQEGPVKKETLSIRLKGTNTHLKGLKNGKDLIALLDDQTAEQNPKLSKLTFDEDHYYRIKVLERSPGLEIASFQDANQGDLLDEMFNKKLEPYYVQIRQSSPEKFQNEDKSWKPFQQVRNLVAEMYLEPLLSQIRDAYFAAAPGENREKWNNEKAAGLRFFAYVSKAKEQIEKSPSNEALWTKPSEPAVLNSESKTPSLADQWKLEKSLLAIKRKEEGSIPHHKELFKLPTNAYSKIFDSPNGDLYFFHLKERSFDQNENDNLNELIARARFLLSGEAQQMLLYKMLPEIQAKHAISFRYLNADSDSSTMEPEEAPVTEES